MGAKIKGQSTADAKVANEEKLRVFLQSKPVGQLKLNQHGTIARDPILKKLDIPPASRTKGSVIDELFKAADAARLSLKEQAAVPGHVRVTASDIVPANQAEVAANQLLRDELRRLRVNCLKLQYLEDTGGDVL